MVTRRRNPYEPAAHDGTDHRRQPRPWARPGEALTARGARVVLVARDGADLGKAVRAIRADGGEADASRSGAMLT